MVSFLVYEHVVSHQGEGWKNMKGPVRNPELVSVAPRSFRGKAYLHIFGYLDGFGVIYGILSLTAIPARKGPGTHCMPAPICPATSSGGEAMLGKSDRMGGAAYGWHPSARP